MTHNIDTTPEAIAALIARYTKAFGLASEAYDKGYRNAVKEMAAEIARLAAERDELRAAIFGGKNYAADLRNGNFVEMANTLHAAQTGGLARAEKAEAERDEARALLAILHGEEGMGNVTPTDATAALAARDAAMRNEGRRQAAAACDWGDIYGDNAVSTILASLEPEGGE